MLASDDVVFAWAIGKALLILIVSFSTLIYAAWVATRDWKDGAHVEPREDRASRSRLLRKSRFYRARDAE